MGGGGRKRGGRSYYLERKKKRKEDDRSFVAIVVREGGGGRGEVRLKKRGEMGNGREEFATKNPSPTAARNTGERKERNFLDQFLWGKKKRGGRGSRTFHLHRLSVRGKRREGLPPCFGIHGGEREKGGGFNLPPTYHPFV